MKYNYWVEMESPEAVQHMHVHLLGLGYTVTDRGKVLNSMHRSCFGRMRRLGNQIIIEEPFNEIEAIRTAYEDLRE